MSLIANPLIRAVIYWNTCGAVNNISSLWKWKVWDVKEFGKFTTTVNIPMHPLYILGLAQLPIEYWIYLCNYQILHNEVKERKRKITGIKLPVLFHSYYCLPTLQSEKTWFKQIQNKLLKKQYQPCISLWDKNYFFPTFHRTRELP